MDHPEVATTALEVARAYAFHAQNKEAKHFFHQCILADDLPGKIQTSLVDANHVRALSPHDLEWTRPAGLHAQAYAGIGHLYVAGDKLNQV